MMGAYVSDFKIGGLGCHPDALGSAAAGLGLRVDVAAAISCAPFGL